MGCPMARRSETDLIVLQAKSDQPLVRSTTYQAVSERPESKPNVTRNNLAIYDQFADDWWSEKVRWIRTLKNLVPGRLTWFDQHIDWVGKDVLDLGCAGGFMSEALSRKGATTTGIDPALQAIRVAKKRAETTGQSVRYDVGFGEALPYEKCSFDAVVCVDVLEHVSDLGKVLAEVERTLRPGGVFLYDTINRNLLARFAAISMAENILKILPQGTHDPEMFIKPKELHKALKNAGLVSGPTTGLGPRGLNRRGDFVFGPLPITSVIYMGIARKPLTSH